jgi:Rap1a immunity proteins
VDFQRCADYGCDAGDRSKVISYVSSEDRPMMLHFFRSSILCLVCVGSLAVTSTPQSTQSASHQESGIFFGGTGGELLRRCNAVGTLKAGDRVAPLELSDIVKDSNLCWGYIAGVVDTYQGIATAGWLKAPQAFCLPPKVDLEQLEKVVKKSLDDNPARLHEQAVGLILIAMTEAFPCK